MSYQRYFDKHLDRHGNARAAVQYGGGNFSGGIPLSGRGNYLKYGARLKRKAGEVLQSQGKRRRRSRQAGRRGPYRGGRRRHVRVKRSFTNNKLNRMEWSAKHSNVGSEQATIPAINQCGWTDLGQVLDKTDLELLKTKTQDPLPYYTTTAGGDTLESSFDHSFGVSVRVHIKLQNQTNHPMQLDLYDMVPRLDLTSGYGPIALISSGMAANSGSASAYLETNIKPTDLLHFNSAWRIASHKKLRMQAGETRDCYFSYSKTWVNGRRLAYHDAMTMEWMANRSRHFLLKSVGDVIHDETTATDIGLSKGVVDCIFSKVYTYSWKPFPTPFHTVATVGLETPAVPTGFFDADDDEEKTEQ